VWNGGDFSKVPEIISVDFVYYSSFDDLKGHDGFKELVSTWRTACPDLQVIVNEIIGERDTVVVHQLSCGTFLGEFLGHKPNGNKLESKEAWFYHFRNGKVSDAICLSNLDALLKKMGVTLFS
jgi:predicted ester cyclase